MNLRQVVVTLILLASVSIAQSQSIDYEGQIAASGLVVSSDGAFLVQRLNDSTIVRWDGASRSVLDTIHVQRMQSSRSIAYVGSRLYVLTASGMVYYDPDGGLHPVTINAPMPSLDRSRSGPMLNDDKPTFSGIYSVSGCPYLIYSFSYTLAGDATSKTATGEINLIDTISHSLKVRYGLGSVSEYRFAPNGSSIILMAHESGVRHVSGGDDEYYSRSRICEMDPLTGTIRYNHEPSIEISGQNLPIPLGPRRLALTASGLYYMPQRSVVRLISPPEKFISGLTTPRAVVGGSQIGNDVSLCVYDVCTGEKTWFDTLQGTQLGKLLGWANQNTGVLFISDAGNKITHRYRYSGFKHGDTVVVRYQPGPYKLFAEMKFEILAFTRFEIGTFQTLIGDSIYTSKGPINAYRLKDTGDLKIGAKVVSTDLNQYHRAATSTVKSIKPPDPIQACYTHPSVVSGISCSDDTVAVVGLNGWSIGSMPDTSCIGCYKPWFSGTGTSIVTLSDSGTVIFNSRVIEEFYWAHHYFKQAPFSMDTAISIDVTKTQTKEYIDYKTGYNLPYPMAETGFTWKDRRSGRVRGLIRNYLFWGSEPYIGIVFELGDKDSGRKSRTLFNAGSRMWTNGGRAHFPGLFDIDVNYPGENLVTMSTSIESFSADFDSILFTIKFDTLNAERGAFRRNDSTIVATSGIYKLRDGVWYRAKLWDFERGGNLIRLNDSYSFVLRYRPDSVGYIFNHDDGTVLHRYGEGFGEPTTAAYNEANGKIYIGDKWGVVATYPVNIPYDPVSVGDDAVSPYAELPSAQINGYAGLIWIEGSQPIQSVVVSDILGHELGRYTPPIGTANFQITQLPTWSRRVVIVQARSDTSVTTKILLLD